MDYNDIKKLMQMSKRIIPKSLAEAQIKAVEDILNKAFDAGEDVIINITDLARDCVYAVHLAEPEGEEPEKDSIN